MKQRPLHRVPLPVWMLLFSLLVIQLVWHSFQQQRMAVYEPLKTPLPEAALSLMTLGDPILCARLLDLWLQSHDNQPGISLPFNQLDYDRVIAWLDVITRLDQRDNYPLMVASQVYSRVNDPVRIRKMLDFVERKYTEIPDTRWRWLAHAAIKAKHTLKDKSLALRYANTLAEAAGESVPFWARDLRIIILEEMGEKQAARILIGGLLARGDITDPAEIRFLKHRLDQLD